TLRSFPLLRRTLDALEAKGRAPQLIGLVMNRVPGGSAIPLSGLRESGSAHSLDLLLEPGVPDDEAFVKSSLDGVPIGLHYASSGRDHRNLFDALAGAH